MSDALKSRPASWMCAVFAAVSLLSVTVCAASCLSAMPPAAVAAAGGAQHEGCASEPAPAPADGSRSDCGTHDHDASWNVAKKALGFMLVLPAVEFLADRPAAITPRFIAPEDGSAMLMARSVTVSPLRI